MDKNSEAKYAPIKEVVDLPFKPIVRAASRLIRHSDGTLYVAFISDGEVDSNMPRDLAVIAHLDRDNQSDLSFGVRGFAQVNLGNYLGTSILVQAMALQEDGSVIVLGRGFDYAKVVLAKFTPGGKLDGQFGDAGIIVHRLDVNALQADSMVPASTQDDTLAQDQNSNSQLISLASNALLYMGPAPETGKGFIARFTPDGNLDMGFGEEGIAMVEAPDSAINSLAVMALREFADGRIVVSGSFSDVNSGRFGLVARYSQSGKLDTTFGVDGFVLIKPPDSVSVEGLYYFMVEGISEGPESSIVCALNAMLIEPRYMPAFIVYLDKEGVPIPSFNDGKPVLFSVVTHSEDSFQDVVVRGNSKVDCKIVAVGNCQVPGAPHARCLVARFNSDGARDTSFNNTGWTDFPDGFLKAMIMDKNSITALGYHLHGKAFVMVINS